MFWWRGGDRFARLSSHSVSFAKNPSLITTAEEVWGFKKLPSQARRSFVKALDKCVFVQFLKNKCVDKIFKNLDLSPGDTLRTENQVKSPGVLAFGVSSVLRY
jgi:hypothetical protein